MPSPSGRPLALFFLVLDLLFQELSELYGSGTLVWDPTGARLHMPLSLLEKSPFVDYRIPGFILLTVLGIGLLVLVVGLWLRQAWAWYGTVSVSGVLLIWIGVEIGHRVSHAPRADERRHVHQHEEPVPAVVG